jgi:ribose-phosphate pyrophosphokinase
MIIVNGQEIKQNHFPDNTLLTKINYVNGANGITVQWFYENDGELFTLICVKDYLDSYNYKNIDLFMPYIPHARMDRVKSNYDVFTLKSFCNIINNLKFDNVIVRDAHSNVSLALLNNVIPESPDGFISSALDDCEAPVVFFPDEGAMKRYSENIAKPYAFGIKDRDWETGKIRGLNIFNAEVVKDKDVLIIDDICSRGGTFYHSAKALKAAGAKNVYLYVTHLETTVFEGDLFEDGLIEKIYTTHSIFPYDQQGFKIKVLDY